MKRFLLTIVVSVFIVFASCDKPAEKPVDEPTPVQTVDISLPEDSTPVTASEDATVTLASDVTVT